MLRRRTFLGLFAGVAGSILALTRALRPSSWWKRLARVQKPTTPTQNEPGIKITTIRRSIFRRFDGDVSDFRSDPQIFYIQGDWRRLEGPRSSTEKRQADGSWARVFGPHVVTIVRPNLDQIFVLNLDASEYSQMPYPPNLKPKPLTRAQNQLLDGIERWTVRNPAPSEPPKPTFRIETVTKDTGERKPMFGYVARHVIFTRKEIPFEGSQRHAQEMTTDGWYIDLEPEFYPSLYPFPRPSVPPGKSAKAPNHSYLDGGSKIPEEPEFWDIGEPETGFALQELRANRMTITNADGVKREHESRNEALVILEKGVYDATLFEVPSGFKRVPYINRNSA
jgi:hypothetical protein